MDKARKLPPAPPLPVEADVSEKPEFKTFNEAESELRRIAKLRADGPKVDRAFCIGAYNYVRRGGPAVTTMAVNMPERNAAGYKMPPPYQRAMTRAAKTCGMDKGSFSRAVQHGNVWVLLGELRWRNSCDIEAETASKRVIAPLTRLLPKSTGPYAGTDHTEDIRPAFADAVEIANAKNKSLSANHVRAAVDSRIGAIERTWEDLAKVLKSAYRLAESLEQNLSMAEIAKAIAAIERT